VRNTVTGSLTGATVAGGGYILQNDANIAAEMVSGIDLQTDYRLPLGAWGTVALSISGSWLQHTETTPIAGATPFDCAGLFGATCGITVNPEWRHNLRLSWETPWDHVMLSAYWRFIGKVSVDNNSTQTPLQDVEVGAYDTANSHIGSVSYLDLAAMWKLWNDKVELTLTVNNVLDKDPPIISGDYTNTEIPNSYPTYDYLGRIYEFGFKVHL
jgi:iron complex outermembrane recepter protein